MDPRILNLPENHPRRRMMEEMVNNPEYIKNQVVTRVQNNLDSFARTRGYDNIISACTYITSLVPQFAAEAQRCVQLRDSTWSACYSILEAVQAGTRTLPTVNEILAELPALTWE